MGAACARRKAGAVNLSYLSHQVPAQQVDPPVAGDGAGQGLVVGGLDSSLTSAAAVT